MVDTSRLLRDLETTLPGVADWAAVVADEAFRAEEAGRDEGLAVLADWLQDQHVIELVGRAWPQCLQHVRHPMEPDVRESGRAEWFCPLEPTFSIPIGELTLPTAREPVVAANHVRWFHQNWGIGVIATSHGDAWVHFSAIQGAPGSYKSLAEDEEVECEVRERVGPPGFRWQAHNVRKVSR